jgi:ABC-type Mn2+/Zn2+ transport system ATPase subunit
VDWDFPISVREVVAMGRYHRLGAFAAFTAEDDARVDAALAEMDLVALQARQINALSGGQQQRALLARALASGADVLLLDEPFAGLDPAAAVDLAARLRAWADQGRLVLVAVHDLALVRAHFTHALLLNTHLIAAGPVADVLSEANLAAAFARPSTRVTEAHR